MSVARGTRAQTPPCYTGRMPIDASQIRSALEAGRAHAVRRLRALADDLERLPVEDAADALAGIVHQLDDVVQALRRAMGATA